jgi:mRNA interferase MazF
MNPGDIYTVNLNPAAEDTSKKAIPVVILSAGHDRYFKQAIIAPVIDWEHHLDKNPFFVALEPDSSRDFQTSSMINCYQLKALDHKRFIRKIGTISKDEMNQVKKSISLILGIEPEHCE